MNKTSQMGQKDHHVSTIASLVDENDVSYCEGNVYSDTLPHISQPQKHTLSSDTHEINADIVVPRPAKRRRKLIVSDKSDDIVPQQQQEAESVVEQEGHTVVREVVTPIIQQTDDCNNVVEEQVKLNDKQFLTSTPNDVAGSSAVDDSSAFITPLTHHRYKRRRVLQREPAGAHITVTSSDGSRVYLRVTEESVLQGKINKRKKYQLLSVPFYQLKHEVEAKVWLMSVVMCS